MKIQIVLPILAAFGLSIGLFAQSDTAEAQKNPLAGNQAAVADGRKLYQQACQSCHGGEGRGDRAPALAGGNFKHGGRDGEVFLSIRNGIRGTQMPAFSQLSADQVWQLVTYIRSLSGTTAPVETVAGNPAEGKNLFNGKGQCRDCHQVNGAGRPVGPDLSSAGENSAASLKQMILHPNDPPADGGRPRRPPVTVIAKTADGREYRGVRRNEDVFSLQLVDTQGKLHLFDKTKLTEVRVENRSLMPADYGTRLSGAEIQNLVAYLKTLNGPNASRIPEVSDEGGLTYERIRNAHLEPQNWLTYWGDYGGKHYSSLKQINTANVKSLQAKWAVQMPGDGIVESIPLVVDGVMYTTGPPGQVFALDARTGRQIWKYQRKQKVVNAYESNRVNRGVAILGNRLFFGTLDGALIALDARTGREIWEVQVDDTLRGYSITSAPLVVKDKILTGVAGGEYGIRGYLDAYSPETGKRLWRFYAVPGPGEFGHDTWAGDSWKQGGGATWLTGSYDPDLNLVYWGIGNPGPDMDGEIRKGDNLFTASVVALNPDTGERKWHYQFTPHDTHDWDATEGMALVDRMYQGCMRKLLLQANRNGVFYVLDRTNGQFLSASPFVRTSWVKSWDKNGRPIVEPGSESSAEGSVVFPSLIGGANFQAPSYSALTGLMYTAYYDGSNTYVRAPAAYEPGRGYWGGRAGPGGQDGETNTQGIAAINPETGKVEWRYQLTQPSLSSGVLATGGGVLFVASNEGNFIALDAKTGKALWHFQAGAEIPSSPMSYSVDGKQYVAVSSAGVLYSFALPE